MSAWIIWGLISVIAVIPVCAFFKGARVEYNDFDDRDPYARDRYTASIVLNSCRQLSSMSLEAWVCAASWIDGSTNLLIGVPIQKPTTATMPGLVVNRPGH